MNLQHRLEQHYSALKKNKHHSHKLQRAVNLYGIENFSVSYEIVEIEKEEDLNLIEIAEIEKFDSYNNGYNETKGGDGNAHLFDFNTRVLIYQICQKYDGVKRQLSRFFDCDDSTIASIANNSMLSNIQFEQKELEALIKKIPLSDNNLKENYIKHNARKMTKEQIFQILSVITTEKGYDKIVCRLFNVNSSITTRLKNNKVYQDYISEFNILSTEEKERIKQDFMETNQLQKIKAELSRRGANPLTQEQINYILDHEFDMKRVEIAAHLGISADRVGAVIRGLSYKDLVANYRKEHSSK